MLIFFLSRILHTKKSLKTASKRYPILAILSNCVKGLEVVGVGENVFIYPFLPGSMLYSLYPLRLPGRCIWGPFFYPHFGPYCLAPCLTGCRNGGRVDDEGRAWLMMTT